MNLHKFVTLPLRLPFCSQCTCVAMLRYHIKSSQTPSHLDQKVTTPTPALFSTIPQTLAAASALYA
jgi:hypothetical protein